MIKKLVMAAVTALLVVALCSASLGIVIWGVETFVYETAFWLKVSHGTVWMAMGIFTAVLTVVIFAILKHED